MGGDYNPLSQIFRKRVYQKQMKLKLRKRERESERAHTHLSERHQTCAGEQKMRRFYEFG